MTDEHTLQVTDKTTAEVQTAIPVKEGRWKIPVESPNGKKTWRYFSKEQVDKAEVRKKVESIPFEERKKRNNVEATVFQYCFHTRNNKTRYRTKIKHTLQAIARCAWINMRRLFLFDLEMGLQMATKQFKDRIAPLWGYIQATGGILTLYKQLVCQLRQSQLTPRIVQKLSKAYV